MGLAILGVVIFHAPFVISHYKLRVIHDNLCCGVDLFLFFSGLGACHSIRSHGGKGYLKNRMKRLLPGLIPILLLWSLLMHYLGYLSWKEFFGSITLLGWWLGQYQQLNWYFSAVWAFFLAAIPLYRFFCRTRHPILLWLGLCLGTLIRSVELSRLQGQHAHVPRHGIPHGHAVWPAGTAGCPHENRIRLISLLFLVLGLWYMVVVYRYDGWGLGYRLGLWWYPYAMFTPGLVILISDLAALLRRYAPIKILLRPFELLGKSSGEILMLHMAIYKIIQWVTKISNGWWVLVILFCLAAGVFYQKFVVKRLPFSQ